MIAGNETLRENGFSSTRFFLGVVASAVFVSVLTGSMVNVILPLMRAEFGVSAAQVGWVFTGFALAYAVSVPLYGRISDFFGVRRVFSVGLVGFAAGGLSLGAAGLVLTPGAAAQAILSPLAGRLSDRVGVRLPVLGGLEIMALSVLFISTFAGASPVLIAAGILGVGTGFAFIQSPANNAAANSLPEEEIGGGMGIFAGAFFLGSGTGPALIGAFLAAREESGSAAINPLYTLHAAPFSDAFLAIVPALILALIAASRLRGNAGSEKERTRNE